MLEETHKLEQVSIEEILEAQRLQQEQEEAEKTKRLALFRERGLQLHQELSEDAYS